ncbi:MAG: NAD(P)/FAD-dependent oxidoreductase [Alphaproteobacteria bacterium]|nr:NAD(P)/FAD-dependent oxidoreductase [Alphaproteobacteria bacterium]
MSQTVDTDIAVIGAGPAGLFFVFEAGMLKLRCTVIDSLEAAGGQCAALYPEKPIYDIPGLPRIAAQGLVDNLLEQAQPFAPRYLFDQQVTALAREPGGGFVLTTAKGMRVTCRAVVIAAGAGAFGPNRPPIPELAAYEGKSVFYLVKRREDFRGKRVVIAGGGDSAVDWALSLSEIAQVMVVHRRPKFRAAPESAAKLERLAKDGALELVIPYQPEAIEGRDGRLEAVIVKDLDGRTRRLAADVFLPFFGLAATLGPIAQWGIGFERNLIKVDPATLATDQPGIYAIGDIATYPGKLKLILNGFAEGAMAAHAIYGRLFPDTPLHFEYSTTKGVPKS